MPDEVKMWTPADLREALNKAHEMKLHVTAFDTNEETLTIAFDDQESKIRALILPLVKEGKKINAIKIVRERMGMTLSDAKDFVDAYMEEVK